MTSYVKDGLWKMTSFVSLSQILIDILNVADLLLSINRNYAAAKQTMMRYQRWKLESKQNFHFFLAHSHFFIFVNFQICWWICDDSQVLTFSRPWPLVLLLPFLQHVQSNNEQLYAGFLLPFFQCSHTSTLCGWISIELGVELLKLILSLLLWLALEVEFEFVALKFGDQMDSFSRRRGGSEGFM